MKLTLVDRHHETSTESDYETAVDLITTTIEEEAFLFRTPGGATIRLLRNSFSSTSQYCEPNFSIDPTIDDKGRPHYSYEWHPDEQAPQCRTQQRFDGLFQLSPIPTLSKEDFINLHRLNSEILHSSLTEDEELVRETLSDKVFIFHNRSFDDISSARLSTVSEYSLNWTQVVARISDADVNALFVALDALASHRTGSSLNVALSPAFEANVLAAERATQSAQAESARIRIENMAHEANAQVSLLIEQMHPQQSSHRISSVSPAK
jgi:hypothetical protein